MSRLDDELKLAFRREQPSADFTERVLARIAEQTKPRKLSLWQRLVGLFQMPTLRWAVAGAVILLIATLGVIQYQRSNHRDNTSPTASADNPSADNKNGSPSPMVGNANDNPTIKKPEDENAAPKVGPSKEPQRIQQVAYKVKRKSLPKRFNADAEVPEGQVAANSNPKAMSERARGEQAKEQLYKALAITSNLLSEARNVAFGGK